jgi:hypothetical protein
MAERFRVFQQPQGLSPAISFRDVVMSGFRNIYPGQTVPAHLQNLVSGYATNEELG